MTDTNSSPKNYYWEFAKIPLMFFWGIACTMYRAWALTVVWSWYLVGFMGIPALSMWAALGLIIVVSFLTNDGTGAYLGIYLEEKLPKPVKKLLAVLLNPLMTTAFLASSWLYTILRPFLGI